MELFESNNLLQFEIFITCIICIWGLKKINFGKTIGCTSGLLINILIFFGIGPMFYIYAKPQSEFLDKQVILNNMLLAYPYILIGLILSIPVFNTKNKYFIISNFNYKSFNINWLLLILSFTSQIISNLSIAKSGIGTIFPVLTYLLYPCIVSATVIIKKTNYKSILFFCVALLITIYIGITSPWRSILIMIIFSFALGLYLRNKKYLKYTIIPVVIIIVIIMPYQEAKKLTEGSLKGMQTVLLANALIIDNKERLLILSDFFSSRINYARETSYVLNGIDQKLIYYSYGESYLNIFKQLIPRFFWYNKPSFTNEYGFELPRKTGLLSSSDENSSWGVNYIAEFSYNFNLNYLPIFIFILFFLFKYIDSLASKFIQNEQLLFALNLSLFYLGLNLVSLLYYSTYFLWIFILIKFISLFFHENTSLRRNR